LYSIFEASNTMILY